MNKNIKRLIPFCILVILIVIVYVSNVHHDFTLEKLRAEQKKLVEYVEAHPILSPVIYVGIYIFSVCLIIPDSTILTLLGGLVFPFPLAVVYAVFAETIGAIIFFAAFQGIFTPSFIARERPFFKKIRTRFHHHKVSYLLFLRLSHVFPFWLTNVIAAYFKVGYWTFLWTCFLGVVPLSVILVDAGHSLSVLFKEKVTLKLSDVFTTQMKLALIVIGLLTLTPIVYKNIIKRKK